MKTNKRILTPVTLISVVGLTLTGCGSTPSSVYDFTRDSYLEPDTELAIQIPEELGEAVEADTEGLLFTSAVARSRELPGAQYCAIDLEISYADGAVELLTAPEYSEADAEADAQEHYDQMASDMGLDTSIGLEEALVKGVEESLRQELDNLDGRSADELAEYYGFESIDEAAAGSLWYWYSEWQAVSASDAPGTTAEAIQEVTSGIDEFYAEKAAESAKVPEWENIGTHLGDWSGYPVDDFDEDSLEEGAYFSEDFENMTLVRDCAKSPTDEDATAAVRFLAETEEGIDPFAEVKLTVMKNGELGVAESEVDGYTVDANGDWITE